MDAVSIATAAYFINDHEKRLKVLEESFSQNAFEQCFYGTNERSWHQCFAKAKRFHGLLGQESRHFETAAFQQCFRGWREAQWPECISNVERFFASMSASLTKE